MSRREFDMAIYDIDNNTCEEYEIKHSKTRVPEQTRALLDDELNKEVESKYGQITRKCVIYRGYSSKEGDVEYLNVNEYLKNL